MLGSKRAFQKFATSATPLESREHVHFNWAMNILMWTMDIPHIRQPLHLGFTYTPHSSSNSCSHWSWQKSSTMINIKHSKNKSTLTLHPGITYWTPLSSPVFRTSGLSGPIPRLGAVDFSSTASPAEKETLEAVMFRLRERANQRRVLAKPCFQDFDK